MVQQWTLRLEEPNQQYKNPSWQEVRRALRQLDGDALTLVELEAVGKASLLIGGGNGKRYVVSWFALPDPNAEFYTLVDPSLSGPDVELTVQVTAEFSARMAAHFERMEQAVRYFYEHVGQRDPGLTWE